MAGYRELKVWRRGMGIALRVYRVTASFPNDERFGLVSQFRRAAVSIPSNIAEGHGRGGTRDTQRFYTIARGSLCEVETQLLLAAELGFLDRDEADGLLAELDETSRMISGLIRSMQD